MSRGKTKRLAWTGSHNKYKKTNAIYKEAYEKIFKKKKTSQADCVSSPHSH
jgi:hypothetical protein